MMLSVLIALGVGFLLGILATYWYYADAMREKDYEIVHKDVAIDILEEEIDILQTQIDNARSIFKMIIDMGEVEIPPASKNPDIEVGDK